MRLNNPEKNLLYASNLWYLGEGLFGPLLAVFSEQIGGNILDVTWAWAIFMVVTGFATIIVGRLALTVRRQQWLAVIGFGTYAMVTFGYIFVHTPAQLMFVQALLGVAQALATPTWYALYAHVGSKASGESWGDMQGQSSIVMGLAFVGGGMVAAHISFQVLFALMGLVQILATVLMVGVLRSDVDAPPAEEEDAHLAMEFA